MTDLRFSLPLGPQPGGAVTLLFGYTGTPVDPPLPDPPSGALRLLVGSPWARAASTAPTALAAPWRASTGLGGTWGAAWAPSVPTGRLSGLPWSRTGSVGPVLIGSSWRATSALSLANREPWQGTLQMRAWWAIPADQAARLQRAVPVGWRTGLATYPVATARWAGGRAVIVPANLGATTGLRSTLTALAPWQAGALVISHGGPWTAPVVGPVPPTPCYVPDAGGAVGLIFREAHTGLTALVFACRRAAIAFVPVRRVYVITNTTSLVRVSDGATIHCYGFSLSLDADSWAWGFSASVRSESLSLLEPSTEGEPVELRAMVNGVEFRVIAESLSRERTFGQSSIRIQGRGKTAVLDAPFSPVTVFSEPDTLTSQQLLDQSLPFGWTANWGLTAWSVPGGVWSHQGTPITAALAIAAAGGGYVQPHASLNQISVLPRYPVAPWDWGSVTPDLEIPSSVMTREGIDWVELPRYNRVFVSGTTAGVLGRVTRTGTAGDVLAQMVTDPLITHVDAARQRGLPVLARTGRWADVSLRLPVLPETGVIRPGAFVRYVDGGTTRLGLVRSVAVDAALPEVWQSIKVETFVN